MSDVAGLGRVLLVLGAVLLLLGAALTFAGRIPGIGRLPGDLVFRRGNFSFYFPLATSILLSLALTLVLSWLRRR